jgi:hypothetical protein
MLSRNTAVSYALSHFTLMVKSHNLFNPVSNKIADSAKMYGASLCSLQKLIKCSRPNLETVSVIHFKLA